MQFNLFLATLNPSSAFHILILCCFISFSAVSFSSSPSASDNICIILLMFLNLTLPMLTYSSFALVSPFDLLAFVFTFLLYFFC